jgi:hypothetical protein
MCCFECKTRIALAIHCRHTFDILFNRSKGGKRGTKGAIHSLITSFNEFIVFLSSGFSNSKITNQWFLLKISESLIG